MENKYVDPRMDWREYAKVCPITKEEILKWSQEQTEDYFMNEGNQSTDIALSAYLMGWFDEYIGKPIDDLPPSLRWIYYMYPHFFDKYYNDIVEDIIKH